ncbi:MAG: prepilin-type N-terminal cleavage/methylation domain-containing protein [Pirellulales bacterium]|nr:prepilin-type N-terminal cleavage/methylation domain-containing protein [Pirellulales bacterium]
MDLSQKQHRTVSSAREGSARDGFTLVEALLALALATIAGAALLLSVDSSVHLAHSSVERTVALGLARQLMDEVCGCRYMSLGSDPYQWPLCANGTELATGTRELFNDIDDFKDCEGAPPESPFGVELGTDRAQTDGQASDEQRDPHFFAPSGFLANWRRTVDVYYVDDANLAQRLADGTTSNHRAVEVRVWCDDPTGGSRELARLRCVIAYVPE